MVMFVWEECWLCSHSMATACRISSGSRLMAEDTPVSAAWGARSSNAQTKLFEAVEMINQKGSSVFLYVSVARFLADKPRK